MRRITQIVSEFQQSFNQTRNFIPTLIELPVCSLRHDLMKEENEEYLEAVLNKDLVGVADALGDMLYVLAGTIISHGMQDIITKLVEEIHSSNMSKLDLDGKPIVNGLNGVMDKTRPMGKVLKSDRYFEPRLARILAQGIISSKQKLSNKVFGEIEQLRFFYEASESPEQKRSLLQEIEVLNQRLINLSVSISDLKITDGK